MSGETKPPFYLHLTDTGYVFDKRIFWGIISISLIILVTIFFKQGFTYNFYYDCPGPGDCVNPFYEREYYNSLTGDNAVCTADWCSWEMWPPGEYGTAPSPIFKYFQLIVYYLVLLGLCLNHFAYNKGKKFSIRPNLSFSAWNKIKDNMKNTNEEKQGGENGKEKDNNDNGLN